MKILKENERYKDATNKAWDELLKLEPKKVMENAKVNFKNNCYFVKMLNENYSINISEKIITISNKNEPIEGSVAVLILHYLIHAKSIPLTRNYITYRELDAGNVYYDAFKNSAIDTISKKFTQDIESFKSASLKLGGLKSVLGEISYEFKFFPRISLFYVLWQGDDEIPGSLNILFDSSIKEQMHTEDVAVIGRTTSFSLLKSIY